MPAAAVGAVAVIAGSVISSNASSSAARQQRQSTTDALDFAKAQEAERKAEYDKQQAAAAYQWKVQQANLAPYRAARASVLGKYGINASVADVPMPEGFGMPGGPTPTPAPTPRPVGPGVDPMLLGAASGIVGAAPFLADYLKKRNPYGEVAGPPSSQIVRGPIPSEFAGPPGSMITQGPPVLPTTQIPSWDEYSQYLGQL